MIRFAAALLFVWGFLVNAAHAQQAVVIAIVNDKPVTGYDVVQRAALLKAMGDGREANPKALANEIIDDIIKIDEATRLKINPTSKEIDQRIADVAKNLKTDVSGLKTKFTSQGISEDALRQFFAAQMSFNRIVSVKFRVQVNVTDADVEKKMADIKAEINGKVAKLEADPKRQPIKAYSLLQIDLPVDSADPQLLQSRAVEANQIVSKFKGCASAKAAASGIFNVKVGNQIEADGRRLPPQMKAAFDKGGVGSAIGPVRGPKGLQVLGYCGTRTITPPKINVTLPTREQARGIAFNEKFDEIKAKYTTLLRKTAVIEYKEPSYAQ